MEQYPKNRPTKAIIFTCGQAEIDMMSEQYGKDVMTTIYKPDAQIQQFRRMLRETGYDEKDVYEVTLSNYKEIVRKVVGPAPCNDTICFNFCDGNELDGCVGVSMSRFLEEEGYQMIGSSSLLGNYCLTKNSQKIEYKKHGVSTAPWVHISSWVNNEEAIKAQVEQLKYPLIVKLNQSYGSMSLTKESVVTDWVQCRTQVKKIIETYNAEVIIEEYVPGFEFDVLVVANSDGSLQAYPAFQMMINQKRPINEQFLMFRDKHIEYEELYLKVEYDKQFVVMRDPNLDQALRNIAVRACQALQMNFFARVDIRQNMYTKELFVLETNDNSDICAESTNQKIMKFSKITIIDFFKHLFTLAKRTERKVSSKTNNGETNHISDNLQNIYCSNAKKSTQN